MIVCGLNDHGFYLTLIYYTTLIYIVLYPAKICKLAVLNLPADWLFKTLSVRMIRETLPATPVSVISLDVHHNSLPPSDPCKGIL